MNQIEGGSRLQQNSLRMECPYIEYKGQVQLTLQPSLPAYCPEHLLNQGPSRKRFLWECCISVRNKVRYEELRDEANSIF